MSLKLLRTNSLCKQLNENEAKNSKKKNLPHRGEYIFLQNRTLL